jgi:hypothetical protein
MAVRPGGVSIAVIPTTAQRVASSLGGMRSYLNAFTRDMLFQEAALCAKAFMMFSPPFPKGGGSSFTKEARRAGENAVNADIRSFVVPATSNAMAIASDPSAEFRTFLEWKAKPLAGNIGSILQKIHADQDAERAFRKARNLAGKYPFEERNLKDKSQLREVHDGLRKRYRGRIRKMGGPPQTLRARPFTLDEKAIKAYVKERKAKVGMLNSGWWSVITKVPAIRIRGADRFAGRTGIPQWVKRHSGALGVFHNGVGAVTTTQSYVEIINRIGDINGIATEVRSREKVIGYRKSQIARRPWQRFIDQACLAASRGQRPT